MAKFRRNPQTGELEIIDETIQARAALATNQLPKNANIEQARALRKAAKERALQNGSNQIQIQKSLNADSAKLRNVNGVNNQNQQATSVKGGRVRAATAGLEALSSNSGGGETNTGASVLQGAGSGAAVGASVGGPYGAAIGAAVGATAGVLKASSARKQKRAAAKARALELQAQIAQQKGARIQSALQSMRQSFSNALRVQSNIRLGG